MVAAFLPQSRFQADPAARTRRETRTFTTGTQSSATQTRTITYNHTQGVRISRDPLAHAEMRQGPNLYAYVANNPIRHRDPTGLQELDFDEPGINEEYDEYDPRNFTAGVTNFYDQLKDIQEAWDQCHENEGNGTGPTPPFGLNLPWQNPPPAPGFAPSNPITTGVNP